MEIKINASIINIISNILRYLGALSHSPIWQIEYYVYNYKKH